jgi:hypothetical protein
MSAFDPAVIREAAMLIFAVAALVKAIWPHGIF